MVGSAEGTVVVDGTERRPGVEGDGQGTGEAECHADHLGDA